MKLVTMIKGQEIRREDGSKITYSGGKTYNVDDQLAATWESAGIAASAGAPQPLQSPQTPQPPQPEPEPEDTNPFTDDGDVEE
jgi:hypothetical protein